MEAYVITSNDRVEAIVIGSETDAERAKERLAAEA